MFDKEFAATNDLEIIKTFSRDECCAHFQVEDGDDRDNIEVLCDIIRKVPENSVIFFDETHIESRKNSYDWRSLQNERNNEVSVIISMQPLLYEPTAINQSQLMKWPDPESAIVVELKTRYRSTCSMQDFAIKLYGLPVTYARVEGKSCNTIYGPDPEIVDMTDPDYLPAIRYWIHGKLDTMNLNHEQLSILYTDDTESDAKEIFKESKFKNCLVHFKSYQGCETPVIVLFFGKEEQIDENYSVLIDMASRAQYKVIFGS